MTDYLEKFCNETGTDLNNLSEETKHHLINLQSWNNKRCDFSGREMILSGEKKKLEEEKMKQDLEIDDLKKELKEKRLKIFLLEKDLSIIDKHFYKLVDNDEEIQFNCSKSCGARVPFYKKLFKAGWEACINNKE
jgi:hypothetical protein